MWIGNLMLLILNLPLIGLRVKMILVPYHPLYPMIPVFCCIGAFSLNNHGFDVDLMALFGSSATSSRRSIASRPPCCLRSSWVR